MFSAGGVSSRRRSCFVLAWDEPRDLAAGGGLRSSSSEEFSVVFSGDGVGWKRRRICFVRARAELWDPSARRTTRPTGSFSDIDDRVERWRVRHEAGIPGKISPGKTMPSRESFPGSRVHDSTSTLCGLSDLIGEAGLYRGSLTWRHHPTHTLSPKLP
jgi:hypothetical protein